MEWQDTNTPSHPIPQDLNHKLRTLNPNAQKPYTLDPKLCLSASSALVLRRKKHCKGMINLGDRDGNGGLLASSGKLPEIEGLENRKEGRVDNEMDIDAI